MPAINPTSLNERINSIVNRNIYADTFPAEIHTLLSFYADRTKRSSTIAAAREPVATMRVPASVMRTLCTAIHRRGSRQEDDWLASAQQLWTFELREMRLVSICMLRDAPVQTVLDTAVSWAAESDDPEVLWALAREGVSIWRQADPIRVIDWSRRWLSEEPETVRAFGLMVLLPLVEEESLSDVPEVLALLGGRVKSARGLEFEALQALLRELARRTPAETTAFLLTQDPAENTRSARLIRSILDAFPAPLQSELRKAL